MSNILKPLALGLALVAGIAVSAQAQTTAATPGPSIANLPADAGPRASSHNFVQGDVRTQAVAPSNTLPGPGPGVGWYPKEQQTQAVTPSPVYVGPRPN